MTTTTSVAGVELLEDYSSRDSRWDSSRAATQVISKYFYDADYDRLAERTNACSKRLGFNIIRGDDSSFKLKLKSVYLCHVRMCPVCQMARTRVWRKRFFDGIPKLVAANPTVKFLFLTLTVKNCDVQFLRPTLELMSKSFTKLLKRNALKRVVLGYARSTEVTKSATGQAHPHFHVLLAVKGSYLARDYIPQDEWAQMWKESLEIDYTPITDIRVVKPNKKSTGRKQDMMGAICETAKYTVKVSDLVGEGKIGDRYWFIELSNQLHATKQINLSGLFRDYIKNGDVTPEEILESNDGSDTEEVPPEDMIFFNWYPSLKKYARYSG